MKLGIILETKEHEKAWNGFRLAIASLGQGHEVKIFLMGEGVEVEDIHDEKFDVSEKMHEFLENGGEILACGTCIKSRHREDSTECPISTMIDCVNMVDWSDNTVTI
ncbi:DsrE family protein [Companilactobacillus baiquanensis]|uniref:DsrE family protein n=1 Tax=Companilactobacillus baiquanensis TaxID=2486005 RepID=A0ABW1UTA3_9LACO|nr:DsrE family protein [Companilactobacillus baiquanensis]